MYLCAPGEAEAEATASVSAIAEAWIELVAKVNAACDAAGSASACTWAEAQIATAARAYAEVRSA